MYKFESLSRYRNGVMALLLSVIAAGCNDGGQDPILGGADVTFTPTVTSAMPFPNAVNVATNTKTITATFTKPMDPATLTPANFTLTCPGGLPGAGVTGVSYPASNMATLAIPDGLPSNVTCTATVTTAAKDSTGVPLDSNFVWTFATGTTGDNTAPTVSGTIHADGATNVAINSKVGATFSEAIDPLTITNANFTLKERTSGNAVAGTVSYSGVDALFIPTSNLLPGTEYTVTVKGSPSGVKDLAGNLMMNDFVIHWTTALVADTTSPTVTRVNPADLAIGVPINSTVNATFSEAMDPLTINTANFSVAGVTGTVTYNATSRIATFTPSSNLANDTTYTATIKTHVKDLTGNALAADKIWRFTTPLIPVVQPTVNLGSASIYGTFGGSAGMTNQGTLTVINGNIGTIATTTSTVTGFHDTEGDIFTETGSNIGNVNGTIYTCTNSVTGPNSTGVNAAYCDLATQARLDAQSTYNALKLMPSNGVLAGNLAGTTINPGVYTNASSVLIQGGDLTLDALGDANAIFVFQIGTTLTVGGPGANFPQSIILAGGAQAKNVFWQVGTSATINAGGGGTMVGTLIAQDGVSFSTAGNVSLVTLNGRALSLGASVTMVNTVINVPAQ